MCIGAYIEASAWTHPYPPARMYPHIGTHLPACILVHWAICTVKRPSVHPWTWAHGSGEASHPHTTGIPTNTPGRTVICVATSGKGGGPIEEKGGGPSYGRADRPMDCGVHVVPYTYMLRYIQSGLFEKKRPSLHVSLGGWVEKMGARFGKKGGRPGKTPARWGKIGVDH